MKKKLISLLLILGLGTACDPTIPTNSQNSTSTTSSSIVNTNSSNNTMSNSSSNGSSISNTCSTSTISPNTSIDSNTSSNSMNSSNTSSNSSTSNSSVNSSSTSSSTGDVITSYTLKGVIVDQDNNGLSGIKVNLFQNSVLIKDTTSDNEGNFIFTNLEEGTYKLSFVVTDSSYEVQGTHSSFVIDGDNETYTYPTITINKKDIQWGELS